MTIFKTYNVYNEDDDWKDVVQVHHGSMYGKCKETWQELINDVRSWNANGSSKHNTMCQQLCQSDLGECGVFLGQRVAMRTGLNYWSHDHEKAAKILGTINGLMKFLAMNVTKFSPEEMRRGVIPACLKPRASSSAPRRVEKSLSKNEMLSGQYRLSLEMRYFWFLGQKYKKYFNVYCKPGTVNMGGYLTKPHTQE